MGAAAGIHHLGCLVCSLVFAGANASQLVYRALCRVHKERRLLQSQIKRNERAIERRISVMQRKAYTLVTVAILSLVAYHKFVVSVVGC